MKKITVVLSALFGAVLVASITLNLAFYRKFASEKQLRIQKNAEIRKKAALHKKVQIKNPEPVPPLYVKTSGAYGNKTVYVRFNLPIRGTTSGWANLSKEMISIQPALPFTLRSDSYDPIEIKADFQPETTYSFLLRKGLATRNGSKLQYDAGFKIRFPALPTRLKTLSSGLIFPVNRSSRTLPLELCNLDKIRITVLKLYENNLLRFSAVADWSGEIKALDYGKEIAAKTIPVQTPRNKPVHYALDLNQLLPAGQNGVYGLILTPVSREKTGTPVQLAVAITDLAPQVVIDKLNKQAFAAIRRISDSSACAGAQVSLVSSKFQTLASGITDTSGCVHLDYSRSAAGNDPKDYPNALLVKAGQDLVFQQNLFYDGHSLAEFESGRNAVSPEPRALVYTERGVYRPGEKVFVTFWVRNPDLKVYSQAPCLLKIHDPNWNVIYTEKKTTGPDGLIHTDFLLPEDARGGNYTVWCQAPDKSGVWGAAGFLAADFMPDRIKVQLKPDKTEIFPDRQTVNFVFASEYYFGGKTELSPYQFTVTARPAAAKPEWRGWTVGSKNFTAGQRFSRSGRMSGESVNIAYPGFAALGGKAYHPVTLDAAARVSEPGGRAVTAHSSVLCHPTPYYLGLRQTSEKDQVLLDWKFFPADPKTAGILKNQKIELSVVREEWKYLLREKKGKLAREWVKEKIPVSKEVIAAGELQNGTWRKKLDSGCYEITALCGPMRTEIVFWHWYGEGGARSTNPSVISCTTDKELYRPGETAAITLHSLSDGFALIAVGDLKLASYREYPVKKGRNTLAVQLPADAQTSACYAGITLVSGEQRQFGLVCFKLEQNRHRLNIALESPETAMPQEKIKVKVALTSPDGQPQSGTVQLFAVDEGVLALTRYPTPDIFNFFYGTYNCDFIFTDIYNLLYPDLKIGRDGRIGGDAGTANPATVSAFGSRLKDIRHAAVQTAAVILPPVQVNGTHEFELALPDHLGAMRLMAIASAPDRAGSAMRMLKMRDKLEILPSAPAVCAPDDESELTFTWFNHDLKGEKAHFELLLSDGKKISADMTLKQGKPTVFRTAVKLPEKEGVHTLTAILKMEGTVKRKVLKIPVRLPNPEITHSVVFLLKPGEKWTPEKNKMPTFAADSKYSLAISNSCSAALKEAVSWLNHYPYGCLEQTVSGAFPFLSAEALKKCGILSSAQAETAGIKANLAAAKILSMMLYNGAFPMWQGSTEAWSGATVYAAHFLTTSGNLRDRKQKNLLAGYLKSLMQQASASRYERAYACYVLALMKENKTDFLTGARNILKSRENDYAAFLAAAALLEGGYSGEAYPHLKRLLAEDIWRVDKSAPHFSGETARAGMTLYILMKLQADVPEAAAKLRQFLLNRLRTDGSGWGVTHANAWAVLGLAELECRSAAETGSAAIRLTDGRSIQPDFSKNPEFKLNDSSVAAVENTGSRPLYVQYRIRGVPVKSEAVRGTLRIQRSILRNGKPVVSVKQGELLTIRIQLETTGAVKDFVLSDLLPGGLEIEDERFATRAKMTPPARKQKAEILLVRHVEKRPGEFVLCGDLQSRGTAEIVYQARAVSRGKYAMGAVSAEAMYEPETRAFEPGKGFFEVK